MKYFWVPLQVDLHDKYDWYGKSSSGKLTEPVYMRLEGPKQ